MSMKNSNDTIENRNRDLPACSLNQLRHRVPCKFLYIHTIQCSSVGTQNIRMA